MNRDLRNRLKTKGRSGLTTEEKQSAIKQRVII